MKDLQSSHVRRTAVPSTYSHETSTTLVAGPNKLLSIRMPEIALQLAKCIFLSVTTLILVTSSCTTTMAPMV